jgi:hypothetical protein
MMLEPARDCGYGASSPIRRVVTHRLQSADCRPSIFILVMESAEADPFPSTWSRLA